MAAAVSAAAHSRLVMEKRETNILFNCKTERKKSFIKWSGKEGGEESGPQSGMCQSFFLSQFVVVSEGGRKGECEKRDTIVDPRRSTLFCCVGFPLGRRPAGGSP